MVFKSSIPDISSGTIFPYPSDLPTGYPNAREAEAALNTDLNSVGKFDGTIGLDANAEHWGKIPYREGYKTGIEQYFDRKYGIQVPLNHF